MDDITNQGNITFGGSDNANPQAPQAPSSSDLVQGSVPATQDRMSETHVNHPIRPNVNPGPGSNLPPVQDGQATPIGAATPRQTDPAIASGPVSKQQVRPTAQPAQRPLDQTKGQPPAQPAVAPQAPAVPIPPDKDPNVYQFLLQIIQEKHGATVVGQQLSEEANRLYDELGDLLLNTFEPEMQPEQKTEFDQLVAQGYAEADLQGYLLQSIPNLEQRIQQILINFRMKYLAS